MLGSRDRESESFYGQPMPPLPSAPDESSKRVLEPQERISEVLFGLVMVLTFTGSLSVAEAGRDDVRAMLIGALGCNVAWGVIDGVLYLMSSLAQKGRNLTTFKAVRGAADSRAAQRLIAAALPPLVASVLEPAELAAIHQRLLRLPEPPRTARLGKRDVLGAVAVFLLVFLSTFPVAVPFLLVEHTARAVRLSNAVALVMLAVAGAAYGRVVGRSALGFAAAMVMLGGLLVMLAIVLGG